jgi:CDGSH-type Zn-finger protein
MSDPIIVDRQPAVVELDAGTYHWCSCGRSNNQPFCDGAHEGTDFTPVEFTLHEKTTVALCLCKHTANPPFCDGNHNKV